MKHHAILAIDTSTNFCSVALSCISLQEREDNRIEKPKIRTENILIRASSLSSQRIFFRHFETGLESNVHILSLIQEVLIEAGLTIFDCSVVAYGKGPGSFTGLRTTAGIVQGIAFGAKLPVIGISSLLARAEYTRLVSLGIDFHSTSGMIEICRDTTSIGQKRVIVAIDARINEVYWAVYAYKNKSWRTLAAPSVCIPELVGYNWIEPNTFFEKFSLIGDAVSVFGSRLGSRCMPKGLMGKVLDSKIKAVPHAVAITQLAYPMWLSGKAKDAASAVPEYIRNKIISTKRKKSD